MAQKIFDNTDVPFGVRVEFYFQWSQWIKTINQSNQFANDNSQSISISQPNQIQQSNQTNTLNKLESNTKQFTSTVDEIETKTNEPSTSKNDKSISLHDILKSNPYGKNVIDTFQSADGQPAEKPQLNENLRKLLCEAVLQYCIEHNHDLSKSDCASLTTQICTVFPDELAVHFHLLEFFIYYLFYH